MKNDSKRAEESTFTRWGKSIASVFKTPKKEVEKHEPAGPCINPEALTAQKREWIDSQAAQVHQALATWPEHLFEHFFVLGLPPDVEVTQIAQDLWAQEVRQRQDGAADHSAAAATSSTASTSGAASSSAAGGGASGGGVRAGSKPQQYDKAPRPAYDAQVLFRHPAAKVAPLSDQELVDLCFPHKVNPVKLRRSPSMSSLHEVVYGRQAAARDDQCFIFLLKVGTSLPLYGVCCAVPEVLHRPPHLARHLFPACRMPFRSVMIAAPRVYCLLSHYPFFDLHFQVLNVILGMERLHRTIDFNAELDTAASASACGWPPAAHTAAAAFATASSAASCAAEVAALAGKGPPPPQTQSQAPPHQSRPHPTDHSHQEQRQGDFRPREPERLSCRPYCPDCAIAIADMYPGLLQPPGPERRRHSRSGLSPAAGRLLDVDPWVASTGAAVVAPRGGGGGGGLSDIRAHGSVRRLSDPGSSGLSSPRVDPGPIAAADLAAAVEMRQSRRVLSGGGAAAANGGVSAAADVPVAVQSPLGLWCALEGSAERCQACGRDLEGAAAAAPRQGMSPVPEQGVLEEAAEALGNVLEKLASLPRAVAASVTEVAAAAVALGRVSPGDRRSGSGGDAGDATGQRSETSIVAPAVGSADGGDADGRASCPHHSDSFLSSDMGTPRAALASRSASLVRRELVAAPVEAMSNLAHRVRDSIKALGGGGTVGAGRLRRSADGRGGAAATAAAATAADQPDGLHTCRAGMEHAAFIDTRNVMSPSTSPLMGSRSAVPLLCGSHGGGAADVSALPLPLQPAWNSSAAGLGGLDNATAGLGSDPCAVSLVQQLMRSVMVPLSPEQASPEPPELQATTGRGRSSRVNSAIQSPELPASPQRQQHHKDVKMGSRQLAPSPAGAAPATAAAVAAVPPSSGAADAANLTPSHHISWSFLHRLGRLGSLTRSPGREASPGQEKGGTQASPRTQAVSDGGGHGLASAFAAAVDLAAAVERQIASPRTPLLYDAAAAATQPSDDWRISTRSRLQARHDEADGGGEGEASSLPQLPPMALTTLPCGTSSPGGGHTPDTASQYSSLPHSGPASRRETAPGNGRGAWESNGGGGEGDDGGGEGDGTTTLAAGLEASLPPPSSRQRLSPPPAPGTAAARLMAEQSGVSGNPSDSSFYSAEGAEEDCTPRGEAPEVTLVRPTPATAAAPSPDSASGAACSTESSSGPAAQPSCRTFSRGRSLPPRPFAERPPPQSGGGLVAVPVGPRARGSGSAPLPPLAPHASVAAARAALSSLECDGSGGGTAAVGRVSLPIAPNVELAGQPSRLGRSSASFILGLGAMSDATNFSPPLPPAATEPPPPPPPPATLSLSTRRSGGGLPPPHHSRQSSPPLLPSPPAAVSTRQHSSGGIERAASPPPPGVAVTADMTHHFSPRRALDQLYAHPLVHPGEQVTLRFGGVATLNFTRPVLGRRFTVVGHPRAIQAYAEAELTEGLQHWTTAVLCRSLSLNNLLLVLSAALLERQIVVFCPHISVLSCCVLGLLPLLRPFGWQSLLLPVTPASMMGFLEAPVPFILGVQYKTSDVMARCSHLIRVNVYKDQVKNAGPPLPQLPGLKHLAAALAPHHARLRRRLARQAGGGGGGGGGAAAGGVAGSGGCGGSAAGTSGLGALPGGGAPGVPVDGGRSLRSLSPDELSATSAFISALKHHLGSLCGDLRPHVITNVGLAKRTGVLMKESLLEVIPSKDKPFVRQFVETQMFSVWSDALISADFEGSFCPS